MQIEDKTLQLLSYEAPLHIGVIEDNKYPEDADFVGMYRVRLFGIDDGDESKLPTDMLPYARVIQNVSSGCGWTTCLKQGSYVLCYLVNGDRNNVIILGVLPMINNQAEGLKFKGFSDPDTKFPLEEYKGKHDNHKLVMTKEDWHYSHVFATEGNTIIHIHDKNPDKNKDITFFNMKFGKEGEETMDFKLSEEAFNLKIGGTMVDLITKKDGKDDEPSIKITHPKGTFIEVDKEGALTISTVKDTKVEVKGKINIKADQEITIKGTKVNLN